MADPPVELCVTCGEGPVEKILFPVAVHFKGSGFYSTDYGRGSRRDKDGDSAPADKPKDKDKPAEKTPAGEKKKSPPPSD